MARQSRPWRRKGEGNAWYAHVRGKCVWLAPAEATKTHAQTVLTRILAASPEQTRGIASGPTVGNLIDLFLLDNEQANRRGELAAETCRSYLRYLIPAREALGRIEAGQLKPNDVAAWLDARTGWKTTTRFNAITAIKRVYNWARRGGHITVSPIAEMPRPAPKRRERVMSPETIQAVIIAYRPNDPFRLLLEALRETGCRPGEASGLTIERTNLAAGTWRVVNKTRHATGETLRTVYLSDRAAAITRELIGTRTAGYVFRNEDGNPWTRNAMATRFQRLKRRPALAALNLGADTVVYSLRHDFITTALERGVPPATVAELVGHKSLTMIMRVYSRLHMRTQHLRDAANAVRGSS